MRPPGCLAACCTSWRSRARRGAGPIQSRPDQGHRGRWAPADGDIFMRVLARELHPALRGAVVVENRPGGLEYWRARPAEARPTAYYDLHHAGEPLAYISLLQKLSSISCHGFRADLNLVACNRRRWWSERRPQGEDGGMNWWRFIEGEGGNLELYRPVLPLALYLEKLSASARGLGRHPVSAAAATPPTPSCGVRNADRNPRMQNFIPSAEWQADERAWRSTVRSARTVPRPFDAGGTRLIGGNLTRSISACSRPQARPSRSSTRSGKTWPASATSPPSAATQSSTARGTDLEHPEEFARFLVEDRPHPARRHGSRMTPQCHAFSR